MRLRELLDPPCALVPVPAGTAALDRELRWVVTTDLPDPSRYLQGGELVVTGLIWRAGPEDSERFVGALAETGAAALAAGTAGDDELPADLLAACRRHRIPLLRVPGALAFATLTEYVVRRISGQRASDLGSVLERHRRLVAAADPAQALGAILELIAADLGLACRVIEAGGRIVAASDQTPALDAAELAAIAHAALTAPSLPARVTAPASVISGSPGSPGSPGSDGTKRSPRPRRSVFPIDKHERATDWFLVLDGDFRQWDPQRRAVVDQVTDVLAAERARLADRAAGWRSEAERLVADAASGVDVARGLVRFGCAAKGIRALAVAVSGGGPGVSDHELRPAALLESAFAAQDDIALIAPFGEDSAAGLPSHAIVLVPECTTLDIVDGGAAAPDPVAALRAWLNRVAPGLSGRRIAVGQSDPFADPAGLKRAIDDARHALRVALTKQDPVTFIGQSGIASHALLLASVPEEVRGTYRDRMLGPILAYDRAHNSELEATLEAFLRASGSWIKCASAMHLHVNTLRYRISRIEELVGRPLSALETQADLLLALDLRASP